MDLVNNIGIVLAVLAAAAASARALWTFVRRVVRAVEILERQLQNNGGGSLKDGVDKTVAKLEDLDRRLAVLERRKWWRR